MIRSTLTLAAVAAFAAPAATAQQSLPTAEQVHARYVEALGGRDAIARQTSRSTWGRFDMPAQGVAGQIEIVNALPDLLFSRIDIPGLGQILQGFDGTTAWIINPATGPMVQTGRGLEQARQQSDFHQVLHPERWIEAMEVVAAADFEGRPTWQVRVRLKSGEEYHEYYDRETGLLAGFTRTQVTSMGDLPVTSVMEGYRAFGDVRMATRVTVRLMGIEQVVSVDSVSTAAVPDSVFALPPAIRALQRP